MEGIYNAAGVGKLTNLTSLTNGSFKFSFSNLTDGNFPVFATTNVTNAAANWTIIGFPAESPAGSGKFQFTDTQASLYPQRFYRVRSP